MNICASVEDKVKKAFLELHRRKVLHGDVRASNILVSGQSVYIIDFESARTASEEFLESEMYEVERLFKKLRNELNSQGPTLS
jgi:tRNA A-37 threonylcarbamoyl transferase component Bud32